MRDDDDDIEDLRGEYDLPDDDDEDDREEDVVDEDSDVEEESPRPRVPVGPQDDPEVVGTLESFGARVEVNEDGWVWRVILYEKGGRDEALEWVEKLPEVRELWTIYTKVTPQAIEKLQAKKPDLKIYK
jgi:hypothetical protein